MAKNEGQIGTTWQQKAAKRKTLTERKENDKEKHKQQTTNTNGSLFGHWQDFLLVEHPSETDAWMTDYFSKGAALTKITVSLA